MKFKVGDKVIDPDNDRLGVGTVVERNEPFDRKNQIGPDIPVQWELQGKGYYDKDFLYNWWKPSELRKVTKLLKALK